MSLFTIIKEILDFLIFDWTSELLFNIGGFLSGSRKNKDKRRKNKR